MLWGISQLGEEISKSVPSQQEIKEGSTEVKEIRGVDEKENVDIRIDGMGDGRLEGDSRGQGWEVEDRTPMQDCTNLGAGTAHGNDIRILASTKG